MKIRISLFIGMALGLLLFLVPGAQAQKGGAPCCDITKIDTRSGVVSAVVKQSGQPFEFRVTDANLLKSLKIGQGVYANFTTHQVSVNGIAPCCSITQAPAAGATSLGAATGAGKGAGQVNPAQPCCSITGVDAQTGIIAAKENATGRIFSFNVGDANLLRSFRVGQGVYANFATHQVSVNGIQPCCTIISQAPAAGATSLAAATAPGKAAGQTNPETPCCAITGVNTQTGIIAAKENATGRIFSFNVGDANLLRSFKVGQGVYANFATHQVSVNGIAPCCDIVRLAAAPTPGTALVPPKSVATPSGSGAGNKPGQQKPTTQQVPSVGNQAKLNTANRKPPFSAIPSPSSPPLTMHDHTLIMQTVLLNRAYLVTAISHHDSKHASPRQVAIAALLYLIKLNDVSEPTKERIRVAVQTVKRLQFPAPTVADRSFLRAAYASLWKTRGMSVAATIQALGTLEQRYAAQPQYATSLRLAKNLLNDGSSTIYSPDYARSTPRPPSVAALSRVTPSSGKTLRMAEQTSTCTDDDLSAGCIEGGGGDPFITSGCDPSLDPSCAGPPVCDPSTDPSCTPPPPPTCDPSVDPSCAGPPVCDPVTDPNCTSSPSSCDPSVDPSGCSGPPYCDPATDPNCTNPPPPPPPACDPITDPNCVTNLPPMITNPLNDPCFQNPAPACGKGYNPPNNGTLAADVLGCLAGGEGGLVGCLGGALLGSTAGAAGSVLP